MEIHIINHVIVIFLTISTLFSANYAVISDEVNGYGEGKVKLELYYESLCPGSAQFIVEYIPKLFENGLIHITDIKFYPFAISYLRSDGTIHCLHGKDECLVNTVEACAIDAWPELKEHFPFMYCVENLVYHRNYSEWKTCFEKLNLKAKPVIDCIGSERGKELQQHYVAETESLEPPGEYVPWVVIDGQPIYEDFDNFMGYICKAYRGTTPLPAACTSATFNRIHKDRKTGPFHFKKMSTCKLPTLSSAIKSWMNRVTSA